jgi:serine/threonine protein phosphatase PrpC
LACPLTPDRTLRLTRKQAETLSNPEGAITVEDAGRRWRVHWLAPQAWAEWRPLVEERCRIACAALPPCRLVPEDHGAWVIAEESGRRDQVRREVGGSDPLDPLRQLLTVIEPLASALECLHKQGLYWPTFAPEEVELVFGHGQPAQARFTNLDLRVFPVGRLPSGLQVQLGFVAPELWRSQEERLGPATDVFHLAMFALYWLADLLPHGFPGRGLPAFNFAIPSVRFYAPQVPPRVAAALARAVAEEPAERLATPSALASVLREALDLAESRWQIRPVHWEIGTHTRTGRAKEAQGRENEDRVYVRELVAPARALVAVADGVSLCDVGTGAQASWLACLTLDHALGNDTRIGTFFDRITAACHQGTANMLTWALDQGYGERLERGEQLMATTLVAGWLEQSDLLLACVGDSRAYLIEPDHVEQLTVDGDLTGTLLMARLPPEEVALLGRSGRALHQCVGGFVHAPDGTLQIRKEYSTPLLTRWPLQPGDVIVLCSDGLVDEGVSLEPEEMAALVRQHRTLPAEEIAYLLAEAADAKQALPSAEEPEGFGDNVSCLVVKIS